MVNSNISREYHIATLTGMRMLKLMLCVLALAWPSTVLALAPDPDLNNDGVVNILDASIVGSCFGADLAVNAQCLCADTDDSGVIDMTDVTFVTGAFGQSGFPLGPNPCVASQNTPPVANAGADQTVLVGEMVTLDGSGSSDVDGDGLTFSWTVLSEPSGSSAALSDSTAVTPTFFANAAGTYVVQLIVNDGTVDSVADIVTVSTDNSPPVAEAGPNQTVLVNETVTLDGSGSSDVDGDPLSYQWALTSVPVGSTVTLSAATAVMPTLVVDQPGTYVAELIVNDGTVDSAPDTVTISTDNSPPVAEAGPNQTVLVNETVTLDGSGSSDVDGDPLSYQWALTTVPGGSSATLSDATAVLPTFVVDQPGTYVVELIVNDGTVDSAPDTATITTGNSPPVAEAGQNQNLQVGATVQLDGSGSSDVDSDPLSFSWSLTTVPVGSSAALLNTTLVNPTFVADEAGTYVAQLIVNDGNVDSAPDTVMIVVTVLPEVTIEATDATASETGPDIARFAVTRTGPTTDALTVSYGTTGSASQGADYQNLSGTIIIPAGQASADIVVTPIDDTEDEGPESVVVNLTADAAYSIGTPGIANATIADNDVVVAITATDPNASEVGLDPGEFTVTRSGGDLTQQVLVHVQRGGTAINGTDYAAIGGSTFFVTIPANQTSAVVTITPLADIQPAEGDETVMLTILVNAAYAIGTPGFATVTISDNAKTIGLTPPNLNLLTLATDTLTVTLGSPAGVGGQIVNLASSNPAIVTVPASILIPEGALSNSFQITAGSTNGNATVTASALGFTNGLATVGVSDREMTLTLDGPLVGVGLTLGGTVTLSQPAPAGGVTVTLGSTNPAFATVDPPTLNIPEGSTEEAFTISGVAVGIVDITADAVGFTQASEQVEVTQNFISLNALTVAPGQTLSMPVSIPNPAPTGGVTVNLVSSDPSIATITPSVFIPQGAFIPAANPQVTGHVLGMVEVTASATALAPNTKPVTVAIVLEIPDPITISESDTEDVTVTLSVPAPTGGLTLNVTVDDTGVATVPATVDVLAGQTTTQIPVTGDVVGNTVLRVSGTGIAEVTSTVNVTMLPPITMGNATIGDDLQTSLTGNLGVPAPAGNLQVTITSDEPARLLLSNNATTPGSASIVVQVNAGSSQLPQFFLQALDDSGTVEITATATGYAPGTSTITLTPSGFYWWSGDVTTTTFSGDSNVVLRLGRLTPGSLTVGTLQPLRAGFTADVAVASSDPAVGTLTSPVTFTGGESQDTASFDPLTGGTTTLSLTQPAGFEVPSNRNQQITATVTAPAITLSDIIVGDDLQTFPTLRLATAPPVPTDMILTVQNPAIAVISTNTTTVGAATLTYSGVTGTNPGTLVVQGLQEGSTTVMVEASGYQTRTATITVTPSGFYWFSGDVTTTTFSANSNVVLRLARLAPGSLTVGPNQPLRAGFTADVAVASSDPVVGTVTSPVTFTGGESQDTASFDPLTGGTTTLSLTQPAGFEVPSNRNQQITATVTAPAITLSDIIVGDDLQTFPTLRLATAPPVPTDMILTVQNPAIAVISTNTTTVGAATLTYSGVTGTNPGTLVVQGLQEGSTTVMVEASGYQTRTATITVTPSGFYWFSGDVTTTTFSANSNVVLRLARLAPGSLTVGPNQPLRAGFTADVAVTSSDPVVGTISSPVTFTGGESQDRASFDPLTGGTTTLSLTQPAGFEVPSNGSQQITATVTAPNINIANVTVGEDLQQFVNITLQNPPPSSTTVTVTVLSGSTATISDNPATEGGTSLTFSNVTSTTVGTIYVQGRNLGGTVIEAQSAGYNDGLSNVQVVPSGFTFFDSDFHIDANAANRNIHVRSYRLDPVTLNRGLQQPLRGGLTVDVTITSSDSSVGDIVTNPHLFSSNTSSVVGQFDPLTAGVTTLTVQPPPGFDTPSGGHQITATVTGP